MMKKIVWLLVLTVAVLTAGCARNTASDGLTAEKKAELDSYMASVREQSDSIRSYLEHEASTQVDMNMASKELSDLWNGALAHVWDVAKNSLPAEEVAKLQEEQNAWTAQKDKALEEAGAEFEGGSIYPLIVNSTAAQLTEERVFELYEYLKEKEER